MKIFHPDPKKRTIDDYDFSFSNGMMRPVSLDKEAGDTVDFDTHPGAVLIHIVGKPSPIDPSLSTPPEDITLFTQHLLTVDHRIREVEDLTFEERLAWNQTFQEMSKTVQ